jgi:hypothetical protein
MAATVMNAVALNVRAIMSKVTVTNNQFDSNGYWDKPVEKILYVPTNSDLDLFDQNGYDLTQLEKHYAYSNFAKPKTHRDHIHALKWDWFTQFNKIEGAVLNHSLLFERKAYAGRALAELEHWASELPLIHKILALRPKWGLDFSMDYVDREGNAFEVLHWEWDSFDYKEICAVKEAIEPVLLAIDWDTAARDILKHKSEWHHLDFFAQSAWKCKYFGVPRERFKMVSWI